MNEENATNFTGVYLLLVESSNGNREVLLDKEGKIIVSNKENIIHLLEIGNRLLNSNLISGYQLLSTSGPPIYSQSSSAV